MLPCEPSEEHRCGQRRQKPCCPTAEACTTIRSNTCELCTCKHELQISREIILTRERIFRSREPVPCRTNGLRPLSAIRIHRRIPLPEIILQSMVWIQAVKIKTWY